MDKTPRMSRESLTEKYRRERSSPLVSPSIGDTFYSRVFSDLIDPSIEAIAHYVKTGEDGIYDVRTELRKIRVLLNDVKYLRADKIADNALRASRTDVFSPGKSESETHLLSEDPQGNEVLLYNTLKKAFDDFMKME